MMKENESGPVMDPQFLEQIDSLQELLPADEIEKLSGEVLICECFCVSVEDIRNTCAATQKVDIRLVQEKLSLGHGCQSCLKNKEFWIGKIF